MAPNEFSELLKHLDPKDITWCAHNAPFDMQVLEHAFNFPAHLGGVLCTYAMTRMGLNRACAAYGIQGKIGGTLASMKGKTLEDLVNSGEIDGVHAYCARDVDATYELLMRVLGSAITPGAITPGAITPKKPTLRDLREIQRYVRMVLDPQLRFDADAAKALLKDNEAERREAVSDAGVTLEQLRSPAKMVALLAGFGVDLLAPPYCKPSPANPSKQVPALAKGDQGLALLLKHENPRVRAIAAARVMAFSNIVRTRLNRLTDLAEACDGRLTFPLIYRGAHTGRAAASDFVNMQNLPRSKGEGGIRSCILAPEGHKLVAVDLSQAELRILAWLSGDPELTHAFNHGIDVYKRFASSFTGKPMEDITDEERRLGKISMLSLVYGTGATAFAERNDLDIDLAQRLRDNFKRTFGGVTNMWNVYGSMLDAAVRESRPLAIDVADRVIDYGPIHVNDNGDYEWMDTSRGVKPTKRKLYGAKLVENICQAWCAVLCRDLSEALEPRRTIGVVHDEVLLIVPNDSDSIASLEQDLARVPTKILRAPYYTLPSGQLTVAVEHGIGDNYAECK